MVDYNKILSTVFANNYEIKESGNIITGYARFDEESIAVIGVVNGAKLNNHMALALADFIIAAPDGTNFLIVVDSGGQETSRVAELLGLNRYFAHLIKSLHFRRISGARIFGLVIGMALGGAFIATGLNAEKIYALPDAQISVMWLEAMSKVTKIPLNKLQELSKTSPIFAPGAENFYKLGAIEQILTPELVLKSLKDALKSSSTIDDWRVNGYARNGRQLSKLIVKEVKDA